MRLSLRTPGILIFGMVMAPCGWVLDLVATVAPNWRTLNGISNLPSDNFIEQGIWDICIASTISSGARCGQVDTQYFSNKIIQPAQGMMVASLIVTLIGLAVAIPGVRCWKDRPNWVVAGLGGLLIFCSGVLTIIPISWYTHSPPNITTPNVNTALITPRVGYCIILGYIGGIFEVLGGFVMFIGILPNLSRARSAASNSSVPYSRDSMEDDVSFPRAKSPPARSVNTVNSRPFDADL
uniref:Claudin 23.2 n=1 Tax=Maylandia zebra TaxID=106582 RepID=A0A3P9CJU9_9CICH